MTIFGYFFPKGNFPKTFSSLTQNSTRISDLMPNIRKNKCVHSKKTSGESERWTEKNSCKDGGKDGQTFKTLPAMTGGLIKHLSVFVWDYRRVIKETLHLWLHFIARGCDFKSHTIILWRVMSVKLNIGKKIAGLEIMTWIVKKCTMSSNL